MQQNFCFLLSELSDALKCCPWVVSALIFSLSEIKDFNNPQCGKPWWQNFSNIQKQKSKMLEARLVTVVVLNKAILCNSATCEREARRGIIWLVEMGHFPQEWLRPFQVSVERGCRVKCFMSCTTNGHWFCSQKTQCSVHFTAYHHGSWSIMPLCG